MAGIEAEEHAMGANEGFRVVRWMLFGAMVPGALAQSSPQAVVAPARVRPPATLKFNGEKPVTGLPLDGSKSTAHCSPDNVAFFNVASGDTTSGAQGLYRVSTGGEVRHLMRKVPMDFTSVSVRDFYVGEQTLVTLLEAVKRADGMENSPPMETGYFLSVSDRDGDLSKLVRLDIRFKPLKVAVFGSGEFMVLGWDEANLLPTVALLKEDGSVSRFLELVDPRPAARNRNGGESAKVVEAPVREAVTLTSLQGAAFVPFGGDVLLTYPGTVKPIRVLTTIGDGRSIPIAIPGGYVLHDVLVTGQGYKLVVRVQEAGETKKDATEDSTKEPVRRLFEMSSYDGSLMRELVFDTPRVSEVTCAGNSSLMAIFSQTIADAGQSAADGVAKPDGGGAKQLVVSTARR
jgi:hypothetical protein